MTEEGNGKVYVGVNCDGVSHGSCAEVIVDEKTKVNVLELLPYPCD